MGSIWSVALSSPTCWGSQTEYKVIGVVPWRRCLHASFQGACKFSNMYKTDAWNLFMPGFAACALDLDSGRQSNSLKIHASRGFGHRLDTKSLHVDPAGGPLITALSTALIVARAVDDVWRPHPPVPPVATPTGVRQGGSRLSAPAAWRQGHPRGRREAAALRSHKLGAPRRQGRPAGIAAVASPSRRRREPA